MATSALESAGTPSDARSKDSAGGPTLQELVRARSDDFWPAWARAAREATTLATLVQLHTLRRRALAANMRDSRTTRPIRLALLGACTLQQMGQALEVYLLGHGLVPTLVMGEYDNYHAEILDEASALASGPLDAVVLLPSPHRLAYGGALTDPLEQQRAHVRQLVDDLVGLCNSAHDRWKAELVVCNFPLPSGHDMGAYRSRTLASDWALRKAVNLEFGLVAPPFVHVCDVEFLAARAGTPNVHDPRRWFESKQPYAGNFMATVACEVAHQLASLRAPAKKVLVLDLDNTLWGGVIGDDGIDGIEVGSTSARGEAFRAFQSYILSLKRRGVLLAVSSKNDYDVAVAPFKTHPEMVLRLTDFVSFKANWGPKSDSIREMAAELGLGLDSFVFVDDNPAEIEIVRQFAEAVTGVLLGDDPAAYVDQLQDTRLFEVRSLTAEDAERTRYYQQESERLSLRAAVANMDAYLASLEMRARVRAFERSDVPRIAQLINKSNQFNLTTRRRTEAEVLALVDREGVDTITVRLADRFGDHGLIAVVILNEEQDALAIDTWLMSCRVLRRGVEQLTRDEVVRIARERGKTAVIGRYLPTPKNGMVADLLPSVGFSPTDEAGVYRLDVANASPFPTHIQIEARA